MCRSFKFFLAPYLGLSKNTWKVISAGFINSISSIITVYIALYLNTLGYPAKEIGVVLSLFGMGGLAGSYLGGYLTHRFSTLTILKASLLFNTLFLFLLPLSNQIYFISVVALFLGLSSNMFRPAFILALTQDEKNEDLDRLVALRRVSINLGMAFGTAVCGLLATISYFLLFWINGLASFVALFILLGVSGTTVSLDKHSLEVENSKTNSNIDFYFILALMFILLLVFNQFNAAYPLYLKNELEINVSLLSSLFTMNGLLIVLFQMPISSILSKKNTNVICSLGAILVCFGFAILPACHTIFMVFLSCLMWTFGEIIFFPAIIALILKLPNKKKGRNIGLYQLVFSLSMLVSPSIGMFIYSYDKNLLWYLSGVVGIIVSLSFFLRIKSSEKSYSTIPPTLE
jgi:MFS family permease